MDNSAKLEQKVMLLLLKQENSWLRPSEMMHSQVETKLEGNMNCINPKDWITQGKSASMEMMNSHHWMIEDGREFGSGVMLLIRCSECGTVGKAMLGIQDSE